MNGSELTPSEQVTIRQYVEAVLAERAKLSISQWAAHFEVHRTMDGAIDRADHLREIRDGQQNEWRETVNDLTRSYTPRSLHDRLSEDLSDLKARVSNLEGRITQASALLLLAIALAGLIEHFIPHG